MRDSETMYSCLSYQGILFDFDGVLSQSMEDNFNAWQAATAEYGIKLKEGQLNGQKEEDPEDIVH